MLNLTHETVDICSKYLNREIPLSELREYQVGLSLQYERGHFLRDEEQFTSCFEGKYAELTDFGTEEFFREELWRILAGPESTGTNCNLVRIS